MKFLFDKKEMVDVISVAQAVIPTKSINSVLSNILITTSENRIFIKATDTKISYEAQVPAQIFENGNIMIYCDKFLGVLNSLPMGEIEFFYEKNTSDQIMNITVRPINGKIKFQIKSIYYKNFPEFYIDENIPYFEISLKNFKEMIVQTLFAVSTEEMRYFMNGVFFEKKESNLNLVATDGRRLSFVSKSILEDVKDFPSVIVHPKILNIILKYAPNEGNVLVAIIEKKIFFKFANYKFSVALLEGQFPNYARVIPKKQSFIFRVKKTELDNALNKHISLMLDKKLGRIYFNISREFLKIISSQSDVGSVDEEISCEFSGEPCIIAFNFAYIVEPLKEMKTEIIAFEFTEEMKAVTMRPEPAQDYFHIIMPMQKE